MSAGILRNARAALAMETATPPRISSLQGAHLFTFEDNYTDMSFDRDVVVATDSTFTVPNNFTVGFAANRDEANQGIDASRIELLVNGNVDFQGADYDNRVRFVSDDPDSADQYKKGDWWGMRLNPYPPSGGVCADNRQLDFTLFRDARYAVAEFDSCAMVFNWPLFENNEKADMYFDRDVTLPEGRYWDLRAPTRLVFEADSSAWDFWGGESGKVDLFVRGNFEVRRPGVVGANEWTWFESTDKDSVNGDDWGGLILYPSGGRSMIEDSDIGFAVNPIFVDYADSLSGIENTIVHHFAETGIWILGSPYQGSFIDSCTVERGADLDATKGDLGIFLDEADEVNVLNSEVSLEGLSKSSGGTGIVVSWGKTFCQTNPLDHQSLLIQKNNFVGPPNPQQGTPYTGLKIDWVCGSLDREVDVIENELTDWQTLGMEFSQSSDAQVNCNRVVGSDDAVDIYRDSQPTGTSLRFKENTFEALVRDSTLFAFRTNDAIHAKLGPLQADRAGNRLRVNLNDTKFMYEGDAQSADTLNARNNKWYAGDSLLTDSTAIAIRLAPSGYSVDFTGFYTEDLGICGEFEGESSRGKYEAASGDVVTSVPNDEPVSLSLGRVYPNPATTGVTLKLAVPKDRIGTYVLEVFDVRGRRVSRTVRELGAAGRYVITWSGYDGGKRASSGIYFLRLKGPGGFVETRKVTLLK